MRRTGGTGRFFLSGIAFTTPGTIETDAGTFLIESFSLPQLSADETRLIGGVRYMFFADGSHIHTIAWRRGGALYWVTNTLLEDLTNEQILLIARSARPLR